MDVDLEALRKLSPELREQAHKLCNRADNPARVEPGDAPSLKAVRRLVTEVIPELQRMFAARCVNMADLSQQAQTRFGDTEEYVRQTILSAASLSRPQ
ncbi:hypothetical protein [Mycobacteroides saopaulense]|uniref:ESX-1 secretion-associated protein n=1 Tax=Mycobacteroides saopaulense TaxID=1578165 RepID=A0A1S1JI60_9MYCO|nr:hypothetical protein [Mycobacteroides saopaulense]MBB4854910.1 hypothetical protein [Mycobacteroides chelonae]ALR11045.1 hypothetical protein MYCSP_05720 [Mycobacteroides saopaulense]OHT81331.1 hypothetical protein BKG68_22625 [Mycobacteroides saopaulense]OHU13003.1 hypothetical protein BKG73_05900 [Mycobacteroides saopaulense]ORB59833.1 hypothetical protein BST43_05760 [Mycobacteroides saopaulense]